MNSKYHFSFSLRLKERARGAYKLRDPRDTWRASEHIGEAGSIKIKNNLCKSVELRLDPRIISV